MPSIHVSSISPRWRNRAGWRAMPTPCGRAGEDHVAGEQRAHRRQLGHELGDEKMRSLVRASCIVSPSTEQPSARSSGVGHLVDGDHPRAHRPVAAARLAERELRAGGELQLAVADVLADREAGDVAPPVGLGDAVGAPADHRDQLDLPVDGLADDLDVVERTAERRRELGERRRDLGHRHARLLRVAAVVEPDREHLTGPGDRAAEVGLDEWRGPGGHAVAAHVDERRPTAS